GSEGLTPMMGFSNILVVCEDTPDGDLALFTAAGLAEQCGAQLTVAAVADVNMPGNRRCSGSGGMCLNRTEREDAKSRLRRARLLLSEGPETEFVTALGARAKALVAAALEHDCDLIVIPASPRSLIPILPSRDDAPRVRRLATVPVMQTPSAAAHGAAGGRWLRRRARGS
ncbi:MAG: universal stress protein, partial [Syntrophothermus sp.]